MSVEGKKGDMLRNLSKRMRDIDRSDGMWKTDKWKTEFQVGKMGKMRMKKFEANLYCRMSAVCRIEGERLNV